MTEKDYSSYFEKPEFKATLARYEAMTTRGEQAYFDPEQLTDIAEYYAIRNREKDADRAIEYALRMHPGSTDPLIFKARTYMLRGDIETACSVAESIPDQDDREVVFLYAELMINDECFHAAEELLREDLLEKETSHREYALTVQDIVELYHDYDYTRQATMLAKETLDKAKREQWDPQTQWIIKSLTAECLRHEGNYAQAAIELNLMLDEDPYNVACWMNLGNAYCQLEEFNKAIDAFEFALAIDPKNMDALFAKGHSFALLNNEEQALQLYLECMKSGYDKALTSYTCGVMETAIGNYHEAISHLEYAYKVYGDTSTYSFSICFNLALCHLETGDAKRAADYYHSAFKINPNDEGLTELLNRIGK